MLQRMTLPMYQADAFTDTLFCGNPAAVVPLQSWLPAETMQQIALENNLSETVFFVPAAGPEADYDIRWFTPAVEIDLCGHATLAAAFILYTELGFSKEQLVFHSQSGLLTVAVAGNGLVMDFPSWTPQPALHFPEALQAALGDTVIRQVYRHRDWLVLLEDEAAVRNCRPDFTLMKTIPEKVIITAAGDEVDFVSRFFAPADGIDEDPVTGSAHSQLIPYWSKALGKKEMTARQLSQRGGQLQVVQRSEERVQIGGQCVLYLKGAIYL